FDRVAGDGVQYEGGRLGNDRPVGEWESYKEEYDSRHRKTYELYWYYAKTDPNTGSVIPGRSIETKWDYAGLDWSVDEWEREGSRDSQRDVRHTILYDTHATLSKDETIWHYAAGQPTSVQTQWDLLGRKTLERSEWRDTSSTLNRSIQEEWDFTTADWSHTLREGRGPADTMKEEKRWYDDNRYQLTLVDVDNQTSAYATWVRTWLKSDQAQLVAEETFHDNGQYTQGIFDPLNTSSAAWSQVITWTTTKKLVKLAETTHADDDTLLVAVFDAYGTDPAYASRSITYAHNTTALLLRDEWTYDDGSRFLTEKDPDDKQAWSERLTSTNAGGVDYYVKTTDDTVNNVARVVIAERYNTGKKLWDARLQELKNGRDVNREEITLSGSERTEEIRDVGGKTDDWWSVKDHFTNGTRDRIDTVFDASAKGDETSRTDVLDTQGASWLWKRESFAEDDFKKKLFAYTQYDNGESLLESLDPLGKEDWDSILVHVGKDDHSYAATTHYDAGTYAGERWEDTWTKDKSGVWSHGQSRYKEGDTNPYLSGTDGDTGYRVPVADPFATKITAPLPIPTLKPFELHL
ncbi:MAG: hypothetical protein ABW026_00170, partial [Microvirga sp.]